MSGGCYYENLRSALTWFDKHRTKGRKKKNLESQTQNTFACFHWKNKNYAAFNFPFFLVAARLLHTLSLFSSSLVPSLYTHTHTHVHLTNEELISLNINNSEYEWKIPKTHWKIREKILMDNSQEGYKYMKRYLYLP